MADIVFSEGSGVAKSVYGEHLYPIRMLLEANAESYQQKSLLPLIFNMETSSRWAESMTGMTSMSGPLPVGEGGDYPHDGWQEGFPKVFKHMTFKTDFEVTEEMVEDSQNLDLKGVPQAKIFAWYRAREQFGARLLGEAMKGNSSFKINGHKFDTTGADEKRVFATDHPSKTGKGAAQCNLFSDAFSVDALGEAETAMHLFTDDNGNILDVAPDTIIIPAIAGLRKAVYAAVGSNTDPNTANSAFNYQVGRWTILEWPYLNQFIPSGTAPWILMDSRYNESRKGAVWFDRKKLAIRQEIGGNDNLIHKLRGRWSAGFNDWRAFCVGGIAAGNALISA